MSRQIKRRTRSGCLTCRDRHMKCDEQIPVCQNCLKSNRKCYRGVRLNFIQYSFYNPETSGATFRNDSNFKVLDQSITIASLYNGKRLYRPYLNLHSIEDLKQSDELFKRDCELSGSFAFDDDGRENLFGSLTGTTAAAAASRASAIVVPPSGSGSNVHRPVGTTGPISGSNTTHKPGHDNALPIDNIAAIDKEQEQEQEQEQAQAQAQIQAQAQMQAQIQIQAQAQVQAQAQAQAQAQIQAQIQAQAQGHSQDPSSSRIQFIDPKVKLEPETEFPSDHQSSPTFSKPIDLNKSASSSTTRHDGDTSDGQGGLHEGIDPSTGSGASPVVFTDPTNTRPIGPIDDETAINSVTRAGKGSWKAPGPFGHNSDNHGHSRDEFEFNLFTRPGSTVDSPFFNEDLINNFQVPNLSTFNIQNFLLKPKHEFEPPNLSNSKIIFDNPNFEFDINKFIKIIDSDKYFWLLDLFNELSIWKSLIPNYCLNLIHTNANSPNNNISHLMKLHENKHKQPHNNLTISSTPDNNDDGSPMNSTSSSPPLIYDPQTTDYNHLINNTFLMNCLLNCSIESFNHWPNFKFLLKLQLNYFNFIKNLNISIDTFKNFEILLVSIVFNLYNLLLKVIYNVKFERLFRIFNNQVKLFNKVIFKFFKLPNRTFKRFKSLIFVNSIHSIIILKYLLHKHWESQDANINQAYVYDDNTNVDSINWNEDLNESIDYESYDSTPIRKLNYFEVLQLNDNFNGLELAQLSYDDPTIGTNHSSNNESNALKLRKLVWQSIKIDYMVQYPGFKSFNIKNQTIPQFGRIHLNVILPNDRLTLLFLLSQYVVKTLNQHDLYGSNRNLESLQQAQDNINTTFAVIENSMISNELKRFWTSHFRWIQHIPV